MRRDFNVPVLNFDGTPVEKTIFKTGPNGLHLVDEEGKFKFERVENVMLKGVVFELLGNRYPSDVHLTGTQLLARYIAGQKIAKAGSGPVELDDADVGAILEVAERAASPLAYGMLKDIINTDPPPG